jgi:hypothetical protein
MRLEPYIIAANFYEKHRPLGSFIVKEYLKQNGITIYDARLYSSIIKNEIDIIQDIQDEKIYIKQLNNGNIQNPDDLKHVEVLISKEFISKINTDNGKDILKDFNNKEQIIETVDLISNVAYKYQLKYASLIFDVMIDDEALWDEVIVH